MEDRWDDAEAAGFEGSLGECVYGSRLLGSDPFLVLHGGGNTSVKASFRDITGRTVDALYVKGSGWDLATIEAPGFTPLPIGRLHDLLALDRLSDPDMMRELSAARLDPAAPQPSVETLLHAFLPFPAVQHSHADVIVTLTNLADGEGRIREVFGRDVLVVPYIMPGFDLARLVVEIWREQHHQDATGMVLLNHGLFTFGDSTREAYGRHVELISRAEDWLDARAPVPPVRDGAALPPAAPVALARLRSRISAAAGKPMIMTRHTDAAAARFVGRSDLESLATRGPLTPDHVIRTKRFPMVGADVDAYVDGYRRYFEENRDRARTELTMLDPAPRVVLDRELGLLTVGETAKASRVAADIYHHTMAVLERSEDHLGGYVALEAGHLFDCEYWDLEQAKLRRAGQPPEFAGMVAVVTGAASGIGRACASALLSKGCAVAGLDLDGSVVDAFDGPAWLGIAVDVTDGSAQQAAIDAAVERFGGIDIVVPAAGVFGKAQPVGELEEDRWRATLAVNTDAVATLLASVHPFLAYSPVGGRVVVIASKNVAAPGRGAAAYSASKAAVTQLARVAALEWADDGIRVNLVHPDGVFDTGLWDEELIAQRATAYGLSEAEYRTRNLLLAEVTSAAVARVVVELCGDAFAVTTGAQVPVDGGNERVV
ncbi:MAG: bifunctional aldolase/short-chain dehydrogenase [bacterium]|nr:bifunctional aldolase/short-chain dehydrogenase [bacterium]MDE0353533.1 bifunctional aldolase/short-chain dehydrogenase [bacterium]